MLKKFTLLLFLAPFFLFAGSSQNTFKKTPISSTNKTKKPQFKNFDGYIVKYKKSTDLIQKSSVLLQSKTITSVKKLNTKQNILFIQGNTSSSQSLKDILKKDKNIESFQPNYKRHKLSVIPDDTNFNLLWGQHNESQNGGTLDSDMDAPEAWERNKGSKEIVIAIIDTGVDYKHSDLAANMWVNQAEKDGIDGVDDDGNGYIDDIYGYDFASNLNGDNDSDPMDRGSHGTHIAGTIGAVGDNGKGVVGINWQVSIMALKVERPDNIYWDSDILEALDYIKTMKSRGVNIVAVNASYGGTGGDQSDLMNAEIKELENMGILFCAAAGNAATDNDTSADKEFPASYDATNIVAVAATDKNDTLASFSGYGATSVDIAAPGVEIYSTVPRKHTPSNADIFFDDMEGDTTQWITGGTNNTWAISTNQELWENPNYPVPSPTHFWSDSPDANYSSNTDSYLEVKNAIDLSSYSNTDVYFAFGTGLQIEGNDWDHAYLEFSKDNGSSWTIISDYSGIDWWWEFYSYTIPLEFKTSTFKFRFHIVTDDSENFNGWVIDNVGVGTSTEDAYGYMQGTSMATPQVVGAVALMASAHPDETALQRKARILNHVDTIAGLSGKVLTSGRLNLNKSIIGLKHNNNFNNDSFSDILWRNTNDGKNYLWYLQKNNTHIIQHIGTVSFTDYTLEESADFNADGIEDLLWRHNTTGKSYLWFMHTDATHSTQYIGTVSKSDYILEGSADFNVDGTSDLLWRNKNDGKSYIWYMHSDGSRTIQYIGTVSYSNYTFEGTRDFNTDGISDLLWRNINDGKSYIWYMHSDGSRTIQYIGTVSYSNYTFEGTGDFNTDGTSDLLWRNKNDGKSYIWYMHSDGSRTIQYLATVSYTDYTLKETGDFNGDGITDLLWRHNETGKSYIWYMQINNTYTIQYIGTVSLLFE